MKVIYKEISNKDIYQNGDIQCSKNPNKLGQLLEIGTIGLHAIGKPVKDFARDYDSIWRPVGFEELQEKKINTITYEE